jgi:hypothetical protein
MTVPGRAKLCAARHNVGAFAQAQALWTQRQLQDGGDRADPGTGGQQVHDAGQQPQRATEPIARGGVAVPGQAGQRRGRQREQRHAAQALQRRGECQQGQHRQHRHGTQQAGFTHRRTGEEPVRRCRVDVGRRDAEHTGQAGDGIGDHHGQRDQGERQRDAARQPRTDEQQPPEQQHQHQVQRQPQRIRRARPRRQPYFTVKRYVPVIGWLSWPTARHCSA